ncbi:hypothetical protein C7C56_004440 [Massilia glaciei]|uniref:Uncharacterized protein n=1 Tax=Massilia glaciei TaxID=1524097 RepID=A0A2U2I5D6_9BURK|nr:hypothetical protein C7C56_004440 [Massilia glaciei]
MSVYPVGVGAGAGVEPPEPPPHADSTATCSSSTSAAADRLMFMESILVDACAAPAKIVPYATA